MAQNDLSAFHTPAVEESPINGWLVTRLAILAAGFLSLAPFIVEFTRG